jgi:hypothetical protein
MADQDTDDDGRPSQVSRAVVLLAASLLVGMVTSVLLRNYMPMPMGPGFTLLIQVFSIALMAFFIFMIWAGHNWARITYLVLFGLGMIAVVPAVRLYFQYSPIVGALSLLQTLLQVIALVMLFTAPGREWFDDSRTPRGS